MEGNGLRLGLLAPLSSLPDVALLRPSAPEEAAHRRGHRHLQLCQMLTAPLLERCLLLAMA